MSDYSELLKHPKWQKKRLEIMKRDEFKCRFCGNDEETLHVHHIKYNGGCKPWEYDNGLLITLCDKCHKSEHKWDDTLKEEDLYSILRRYGIPSFYIARIIHWLDPSRHESDTYIKQIFLVTLILEWLSKGQLQKQDFLKFILKHQDGEVEESKKKKKRKPKKVPEMTALNE